MEDQVTQPHNPMNENYGYILIDTDEKKEKFGPIQEGDEWFAGGVKFEKLDTCFGKPFWLEHDYRRPLVLPDDKDWELVPLDGKIHQGDEFTVDGYRWSVYPASSNETLTTWLQGSYVLAVRRRKQAKQAPDLSPMIQIGKERQGIGTEKPQNPPAFPIVITEDHIVDGVNRGMTLRDYIAAKAMQGILASPTCDATDARIARAAYDLADAMLAEREKGAQ